MHRIDSTRAVQENPAINASNSHIAWLGTLRTALIENKHEFIFLIRILLGLCFGLRKKYGQLMILFYFLLQTRMKTGSNISTPDPS